MNQKQPRTLEAIFKEPVVANIDWKDVESLFQSLGSVIKEGRGSRVRVVLNGVLAVFHRPYPDKEATKGRVRAVRDFLENAGVKP